MLRSKIGSSEHGEPRRGNERTYYVDGHGWESGVHRDRLLLGWV